ncbi:hypothetical protein KPSA1_00731 [Pseudomonas syringae pv. actinidiae]|uniref:Uncharacterized protein n=1 Tax=Pseudomonas syringae pv. actinidiae TaxID=103796 RepID=A0A2V0QAB9_PSESF|nr:hypothetical protein KPSA1_00731 [Pseudomonas syringae pv. actinidiae]
MSAKPIVQTIHFQGIHRLFRGQVRSHGLRPESRAALCRSGLVREDLSSDDSFSGNTPPFSRTSPTPFGQNQRRAGGIVVLLVSYLHCRGMHSNKTARS